jgi:beta-lactamase class D
MNLRYILAFCLFFSFNLNASECFIIKDLNEGKIIKKDGGDVCETRFSPCSSFKIPLSLIGFDSGVLKNEKEPEMEWKEGYHEGLKEFHHFEASWPEKWMKTSAVWYSQEAVTKKIGMEKFEKYVKELNYGNVDLSGDENKNNGLTHSWLESSLKISPLEQIEFLEKMLNKKFKISDRAYEMTEKITYIKDINGWRLHGKTGSCSQKNDDGSKNPNRFAGWFVGWIEKDDRKIVNYRFRK